MKNPRLTKNSPIIVEFHFCKNALTILQNWELLPKMACIDPSCRTFVSTSYSKSLTLIQSVLGLQAVDLMCPFGR